MKRVLRVTGIVLAVLLLILPASGSVGNAGHARAIGGSITIQSWLHASPSASGLSGTVTAGFKLKGAFVDQGGNPTWTDKTYATVVTSFATKVRDWQPVGGFILVPPVKGTLSTLYAVHTITGQKGQIYITFAGTYDFVKTFQGSGTWMITGGTDAYQGVMGQGTWTADASHFPYIRHTEIGQMYFVRPELPPAG